jgi:hypothetical protein
VVSLARELHAAAERHAAEHDVYHQGHTQARLCAEHLRRLAPLAKEYGASDRGGEDVAASPSADAPRQAGSRLIAGDEASGMLLLYDLRDLYVAVQRAQTPIPLRAAR